APGATTKNASIAVGDVINTRLAETGTTTTAILRNITMDTKTISSHSANRDASVLVGDFGSLHVPTFTNVHFARATVNGAAISDATPVTRERLRSNTNIQISANLIASPD